MPNISRINLTVEEISQLMGGSLGTGATITVGSGSSLASAESGLGTWDGATLTVRGNLNSPQLYEYSGTTPRNIHLDTIREYWHRGTWDRNPVTEEEYNEDTISEEQENNNGIYKQISKSYIKKNDKYKLQKS